ncbi:DUF1573 domain-containing protein, partial [Candidatus Bipolaricaulota bacterium]|nr:DUF1573 domain-containing protein [Candidatus Bipolaricaulota bacterium]
HVTGRVALAIAVCLGLGAFTSLATPAILVDAAIHDFGTVNEGYVYYHTYIISNGGTSPLVLERVRPNCGCTTVDLPSNTIQPGTSIRLDVSFDTTGMLDGVNNRYIYIDSNDPIRPESFLTLTATVQRAATQQLSPQALRSDFYMLLDLRDEAEFAAGHLIGALNVPLAQLGSWSGNLPREAVIFLIDDAGSRSSQAADTLQRAGYEGYAIEGGLAAWVGLYGNRLMTSAIGGLGTPISPSTAYSFSVSVLAQDLYYILVDIRNPVAYAAGHLIGAVNVSSSDLPGWAAELPRDVRIVVYGQQGAEADRAALALRAQGYSLAHSLIGGFDHWLETQDDPRHPERSLVISSADEL